MNSSELLVIAIVAIIVFGPGKLPMLAQHLGKLFRHLNHFRDQAYQFWQKQMNEQQLLENERKAKEADSAYQQEKE
ncbi:TatB protein (twin arginine translocation) [Legionella birminghamensis]|uniref:TatB protein (Twin arginine translocation) n=1 Tax=Legionella birminghamensis TaxID=28083 RepID=A0A378IET2_9GAMM|nr:twin-arginine translocase TatA/TatE family subunit [Legionella birminghamensis]KTC68813.1 TatB protein (twin arginine translocation) [Legionella birminghamensis]STX33245.1 TatB protein (twin arginine translocation) [Legionella birminghamensis]